MTDTAFWPISSCLLAVGLVLAPPDDGSTVLPSTETDFDVESDVSNGQCSSQHGYSLSLQDFPVKDL